MVFNSFAVNSHFQYLICINCKKSLSDANLTNSSLVCPHCKKEWQVRNKRLIFSAYYDDYRGEPTSQPSIIRERLSPRIYDFTFVMTRSYRIVFNEFLNYCDDKAGSGKLTILDIGCGFKPFADLFSNKGDYIGIDISLNSYADFITDNNNLPFADNSFDVIIASEVLEHTTNEYEFVEEIRRVAKDSCIIFISLPFVFPEHGTPFDFQRFTKYKLKELFKMEEIISIKESNNFISTLLILPNIFLKTASTTNLRIFFYPVFIMNNILALINEKFWAAFIHIKEKYFTPNPYLEKILNSCPLGYSLIIRVKK